MVSERTQKKWISLYNKIEELYKSGKSLYESCVESGISITTYYNICKQLKLNTAPGLYNQNVFDPKQQKIIKKKIIKKKKASIKKKKASIKKKSKKKTNQKGGNIEKISNQTNITNNVSESIAAKYNI